MFNTHTHVKQPIVFSLKLICLCIWVGIATNSNRSFVLYSPFWLIFFSARCQSISKCYLMEKCVSWKFVKELTAGISVILVIWEQLSSHFTWWTERTNGHKVSEREITEKKKFNQTHKLREIRTELQFNFQTSANILNVKITKRFVRTQKMIYAHSSFPFKKSIYLHSEASSQSSSWNIIDLYFSFIQSTSMHQENIFFFLEKEREFSNIFML